MSAVHSPVQVLVMAAGEGEAGRMAGAARLGFKWVVLYALPATVCAGPVLEAPNSV